MMGKFIIKIKDMYYEWSTIVDAPVTYGMTLKELEEHIRYRYGQEGINELPKRLERVNKQGTSQYFFMLDDLFRHNRAGDNGECLTKDEIYNKFSMPQGEVNDD